MSAYIDLFRQPGYPWIDHQVTPLLDVAFRVILNADDQAAMAEDLARAVDQVAAVIREAGVDESSNPASWQERAS